MDDLIAGDVLGKVAAHCSPYACSRFQKRDLPHAHILIILAACDRVLTAELVDRIVVAERFPKDFQKQTVVDKDNNYPIYRRR